MQGIYYSIYIVPVDECALVGKGAIYINNTVDFVNYNLIQNDDQEEKAARVAYKARNKNIRTRTARG